MPSSPRPPHAPAVAGSAPHARVTAPPAGRRNMYSWLVLAMFAVLVVMFIPPNLADPGANARDAAFGAPDPTQRAIKLAVLAVSAGILAGRLGLLVAMARTLNAFFLAMLALIPISILWSIDPGATQARFVSLMTGMLVAFAVAVADSNPRRLQAAVRPVLTAFLIGSIAVGIFSPDMVLEKGNDISLRDAWHGLASQKNEFGQIASFGVIFWLHAWLTREGSRLRALLGLGLGLACIWLSRSSTSLLATLLAAGIILLQQRPPPAMRRYMPYLVTGFTALALLYALAVLNLVPGLGLLLEPFAALSGKDLSFSNRMVIWDIIKEHIQLAPLLGSGYGAYWVGPLPTSPSYVFLARAALYPTQSHNGFLEITNDLGFVGLACLLGYLIVYVRQCLQLARFDRAEASLYVAIVLQQVVVNLSESCWISSRSVSSIVMSIATVTLARTLYEHRKQQRLARFAAGAAPRSAAGGMA
jgi:O-antigen ligase